jgi:neutral trehalase
MASEYRCMTRLALALGKERDAEVWAERHAAVCQRVNAVIWDDETRLYFDYEDDFVRVKAASSLLPLLGGIPDRDRAEALRQHLVDVHSFATPVPVPSVAREEPTWSTDMWRGPTWMNVNLLIYDGLCQYGFLEEARRLARRTMDEIVRWYAQSGCTYEYYDSLGETHPRDLNRKGPAEKARAKRYGVIADYNWTAAVYIYLANQTGR